MFLLFLLYYIVIFKLNSYNYRLSFIKGYPFLDVVFGAMLYMYDYVLSIRRFVPEIVVHAEEIFITFTLLSTMQRGPIQVSHLYFKSVQCFTLHRETRSYNPFLYAAMKRTMSETIYRIDEDHPIYFIFTPSFSYMDDGEM